LGLGSIFNHSKRQNVGFRRDIEGTRIIYSTLRNVEAGEELCISYGPRLWFEDVEQDEADDRVEQDNPLDDINRIDLGLSEEIGA
jgi:SET domain-containing protein